MRTEPVPNPYPYKPVLFVRVQRGPTFAIFAAIFQQIHIINHMKIDIVSESLVVDVGYLYYPLVNREIRSHQEFPNHMIVGGCGQECWNMLEQDNFIHFFLHHQNCKFENIGFYGKTSCFFHIPRFCRFLNFKVFIIRNIFPN